jgi:hypothetical protein
MLRDAVREMACAARADEVARQQRLEARAELTRAEAYAAAMEDLVELDHRSAPEPLVTEIRRFVRRHSRRLARGLGTQPRPARVLDVLFDVQERIQQRMGEGMAARAA